MTNCKYKLRKLSVGLVSVGTMLIAPTVLGQEVSASTTSTETSAASAGTTASGTTATTPSATTGTGEAAGSGTNGASSVTSSGGSQSSESAQASTQPQAQTAVASSSSSSNASASSSETQASKAANTTSPSSPVAASSNDNQVTGTEAEPQMMDVEKYTVDKENSELTVKDDNQQLKIRRDIGNPKDKELFDVKREVKDNGDGTLDVTLKVTPKEIDKGADVMALLDVSKKMSEDDFKNAKEKIKKLVTTLTSKAASNSDNDEHKHNSRNSVRLMTFYREISKPIDISGKTNEELDELLDRLRQEAKDEYDWGVDLQGAIHKAREIFKQDQEKKSGKRQHIVLFSQGESTFSYDIKNKDDKQLKKARLDTVTTSNPLFSWFPIFDHTNRKADMLDDVKKLVELGKALGMDNLNSLGDKLKLASTLSGLVGDIFGGGSLTEYLTLEEYNSRDLQSNKFDYENRVGEGYHHYTFAKRTIDAMPLKSEIKSQLKGLFDVSENTWFGWFLKKLSLKENYQNSAETALLKILEYLFYKRKYIYYNHNLSAIAEAKMAQKDGITFYSVDVTSPNQSATTKRSKRSTDKTEAEKRNEKFDKYLKEMSEGNDFLKDTDIEGKDKFKDTLTELKIKDEFNDKVSVIKNSWKNSLTTKVRNLKESSGVEYKSASSGYWGIGSSKESLTWTISKEQLKTAFESGQPLTLTYKLKVEKEKFKEALEKQQERNRKKRAASSESENTVTDTIISNKISYKINNGKDTNDNKNKLEDVKMSYSKFKMPIPELDIEVVVPKVPEKPLVEPMTPLYPAIPNYPTPQLPKDEDLEISGGHGPIVDIVEDTGTGVEGGAQNGVVSTQENKDPIVDITEDTQPGMSGSNDATVVEEDTTPKRPDVLVGGQSDPIDITQDTQPGMSGSNDATVINEDTKPKRFFHFDNEPQAPEKPKEQPSLQDSNSLPQAPAYKAAHHLPASGDKREVYFTIAALTIIGAAGLLSKKRRDTEEN
ncbi:serum opacification factor [Streptococcus pyogenes]|uniref:serum opacification factor n=1 Tax=Streptococcus pyogenes TaxID=1314 RepID=UPI0010A1C1EE|nr:serum opacification factor [Streptococcus pyogenes]VGV01126.1 Fibronectin-binding protein [Streptococcus pyogenes]